MHVKLGGPRSLKTECEVTCAKDRRENNLRKGLKQEWAFGPPGPARFT